VPYYIGKWFHALLYYTGKCFHPFLCSTGKRFILYCVLQANVSSFIVFYRQMFRPLLCSTGKYFILNVFYRQTFHPLLCSTGKSFILYWVLQTNVSRVKFQGCNYCNIPPKSEHRHMQHKTIVQKQRYSERAVQSVFYIS
jgi:hypothetical protein